MHRAEVPVLDLKNSDPDTGVKQHDVGTETVEMRLNVNLPLGI